RGQPVAPTMGNKGSPNSDAVNGYPPVTGLRIRVALRRRAAPYPRPFPPRSRGKGGETLCRRQGNGPGPACSGRVSPVFPLLRRRIRARRSLNAPCPKCLQCVSPPFPLLRGGKGRGGGAARRGAAPCAQHIWPPL